MGEQESFSLSHQEIKDVYGFITDDILEGQVAYFEGKLLFCRENLVIIQDTTTYLKNPQFYAYVRKPYMGPQETVSPLMLVNSMCTWGWLGKLDI
tara:strand:- start:515 stop:799 length:285 start_codon:yes stop_codon:yes gene_type:complete